jgi:hypothetical protein
MLPVALNAPIVGPYSSAVAHTGHPVRVAQPPATRTFPVVSSVAAGIDAP